MSRYYLTESVVRFYTAEEVQEQYARQQAVIDAELTPIYDELTEERNDQP